MSNQLLPLTVKTVKGVYCHTHKEAPGYIICSEVSKFNKIPTHIVHPTATALGEIMCERKNHELWEFSLIDVHCARERGFLTDPANKPTLNPGTKA